MDKRRFARISKRLFVRFGAQQAQHIGFTDDVSREGLFIKSNVVFKQGTPLIIEANLPKQVVSLKGIVKWAKAVPPALFRQARKAGVGVNLEQFPELYASFVKALEIDAGITLDETSPGSSEGAEAGGADGAEEGVDERVIAEAYGALSDQNHYQVLRVAQTATQAEIKRAYYAVAKLFHPDRHHRLADPAGVEQVKTLFCRVNDAYRVLSSDDHRRAYDFELSVQKLGLAGREQAGRNGVERDVQLGRQALKERQITTAVYYFERAVRMIPDKSVYHDLLAQALSHLPRRKREAEQHYKKAIELEPARTEYYCHLGHFYKQEGFPARALEQFEKARVWDPDDHEILAAVRTLKGR